MGRLLTEDGFGALDGYRIFVLCPDPDGAFEIAERLERAGAEAVTAFDFHQLSTGLDSGFPDGAVAELSDQHRWPSVGFALLHELAVPQVLAATERQRHLLRPKMPNTAFIPAPINPEDAALSLSVLLGSNWPRMLRSNWSGPRHRSANMVSRAQAAPDRPRLGLVTNG